MPQVLPVATRSICWTEWNGSGVALCCPPRTRARPVCLPVGQDVVAAVYHSAATNPPRAASTVESTGNSSLRPQAATIRLTTG
jgi:hypothetical protein